MTLWQSETTPNFSLSEMACKCGKCKSECNMQQEFMERLQIMRAHLGPMVVTSGYRCPLHPEEAKKARPGAHAQGQAADIAAVDGEHRFKILQEAVRAGMVGIGIANSFIHVDDGHDSASRPWQWKYS